MVRKAFFIALSAFFLSLTFAACVVAGEFTASVSSTQVQLNESFSLNLALKGTSAKGAPEVSALKKHFLIHSQHHSNSTTIVNGKVSSSVTWKLSLISKTEGVVQIPSITVATAEGILSTQPITLNVTKGAPQSSVDNTGPKTITKVSNALPYKNEPLIYSTFLIAKMPLYDVQTQKIQVEDAIVELLEEPKLEQRTIGDVLYNFVEFSYLITPLKTGSLTIPPIAIQGAIPKKGKGQFSSFFNDIYDPFATLQPFTLMTEEIQLDVQPAISEVSPWLPAKSLSIEELWPNEQTLRVGEPFSRGFLVKAEGLKASQLPRLEDLQNQISTFRVYADKPEEQEKVIQETIHSSRKEQYTLIPQQPGTWELPEISINWWDSVKKEKRTSSIAARTVQILPALETATAAQEVAFIPLAIATSEETTSSVRAPFLLYAVIGTLTFLLLVALLWGIALKRKITSFTKDPVQKPIKPHVPAVQSQKRDKLPDLNPT